MTADVIACCDKEKAVITRLMTRVMTAGCDSPKTPATQGPSFVIRRTRGDRLSRANLGLVMSRPSRLDAALGPAKNEQTGGRPVHVVEHPDPEGRRWARALELILEAGRSSPEVKEGQ